MAGDIETVLTALDRSGVRYLIAGGVAVVLHGFLRTTADLDLVVQLEPENVQRALEALDSLGYRPRASVAAEAFADRAIRESWVREKNLEVFSMWSDRIPRLEVDLFVREPFDFDSVYQRAPVFRLEGTITRVVPREVLIEMKRRSGRPLDLVDAEALETLGESAEG